MTYDPSAPDPLNAKPNWEAINDCQLWPVLGITECNNCPKHDACWGKETVQTS